MNNFQNTDFSEPYSSVSFQYKQLTSPFPYNNNNSNNNNNNHGDRSFTFPKRSQVTRWFRHHQRVLLLILCLLLVILFLIRDVISSYWTFIGIKMNNTMFDRGYVACGVLRKEPMLYVQDSQHVQVVWEMNCGMSNKDMYLSYQINNEEHVIVVGPIEARILDQYHTLYKATIGPVEQGGTINYKVETRKKGTDANGKKKVIAAHSFNWFARVDTEPIRVAAIADNQFGMLTFSSLLRQIRKFPKDRQPHFLLHAGDAVQNYPSLRQWQTDFAGPLTVHGLSQRMPLIYAHGNHDYDRQGEYTYTRSHKAHEHSWFSFSMANGAIRFIVLDSNIDWYVQDEWLKQEIHSEEFKQAQFRIVVVHVPPFLEYWDSHAWFQQGESEWGTFVKDRFVPLFEEGGVDVVISGHQHNYERGERKGIHYAIIGGGGGDLDFEQVVDWAMYDAKVLDFHFVLLEFKPPTLELNRWTLQWDTFDIKGKKVDSVLIEPRDAQ